MNQSKPEAVPIAGNMSQVCQARENKNCGQARENARKLSQDCFLFTPEWLKKGTLALIGRVNHKSLENCSTAIFFFFAIRLTKLMLFSAATFLLYINEDYYGTDEIISNNI